MEIDTGFISSAKAESQRKEVIGKVQMTNGGGADTPPLKFCNRCEMKLPLSDFSDHPFTSDRRQPLCKSCNSAVSIESRNYRLAEAEKERAATYAERSAERRAREREIEASLCLEQPQPESEGFLDFINTESVWAITFRLGRVGHEKQKNFRKLEYEV